MTVAVYEVVMCPVCESPNLPSSTVCGECGERLQPVAVDPRALPARHGDGCPCVPCTLNTYNEGRRLDA